MHYNYKLDEVKSKVGDHSRGWPEGSLFDSLQHQGVGEGATPFPGLLHFTLDPHLIMLSDKQGGIKYYESLVCLDLGSNPGLPGYWRTL